MRLPWQLGTARSWFVFRARLESHRTGRITSYITLKSFQSSQRNWHAAVIELNASLPTTWSFKCKNTRNSPSTTPTNSCLDLKIAGKNSRPAPQIDWFRDSLFPVGGLGDARVVSTWWKIFLTRNWRCFMRGRQDMSVCLLNVRMSPQKYVDSPVNGIITQTKSRSPKPFRRGTKLNNSLMDRFLRTLNVVSLNKSDSSLGFFSGCLHSSGNGTRLRAKVSHL